MKKKIITAAIVNVVAYFNQINPDVMKALPTKMRWNIRKNMGKFIPIAKEFEDFRNDLVKELQEEWFTEDKSELFTQEKVDANGNPILDANGNVETEEMRRIRQKYMDEYNKAVSEVNSKLSDILMEVNEIEIVPIDIDAFVDTMPDDSPVTFDDLDVLSIFQEE